MCSQEVYPPVRPQNKKLFSQDSNPTSKDISQDSNHKINYQELEPENSLYTKNQNFKTEILETRFLETV